MRNGLSTRIIARTAREWGKRSFDRVAKQVLVTRPLELRDTSPLFLSMVCHRDVVPYLVAIKSLYLGVGQGKVAVINDGSLTSVDVNILRHHIPGIVLFDIADIPTGSCPRGGTWERLVKILELSAENYVIQADADILVSAPIPEVVHCWQENKSFLLGTDVGQEVMSADDVARMVKGWIKKYNWKLLPVGVEAEASLDALPNAGDKFYVHASSGFAGFAHGAFAISDLEQFSAQMEKIIGRERWSEWGTEQIGSNYMLANSSEPIVLPFPKYACFEPSSDTQRSSLVHYIGTYRYNSATYRKKTSEFLISIGT